MADCCSVVDLVVERWVLESAEFVDEDWCFDLSLVVAYFSFTFAYREYRGKYT